MTLIGNSITGIGFIPSKSNSDTLFYLKKYNTLLINEDYEYMDSDWYKQLQRNNQAALFVPSNTASAANTISLIRTVKNIDKRQVVGYEILDISLDFIFESLKDISMSQYSGIFLESPKQELLFSTNEALTPVLSSLLGADNGIKRRKEVMIYILIGIRTSALPFIIFPLAMTCTATCVLPQAWSCYSISAWS